MSWFYIALLAPILYAITNLVDDNMLQFVFEGPFMATALAGIFGALPLLSLLFLHTNNIPFTLAVLSVVAGVLTTTYFFFYFKALQIEEPSVVVALFNLVPATLPFLAYFLLRERLTAEEIVGFVFVLLASIMLTATDIKKFKFSKALVPMLIAVALVDIVSLLTKHVYQHAHFYPVYMYFSAGVGIAGLAFLMHVHLQKGSTDMKKLKITWVKVIPILIISNLTALAADFTVNLAISRGPVSLVKVIEGVQPAFVLLIAVLLYPFAPKLFREAASKRGNMRKFILMIVMVAGLVIIDISSKA